VATGWAFGRRGADPQRNIDQKITDVAEARGVLRFSPDAQSDLEKALREISEAKALLISEKDDDIALAAEIQEMDEAVKRANGRLKLIDAALAGPAKDD